MRIFPEKNAELNDSVQTTSANGTHTQTLGIFSAFQVLQNAGMYKHI